LVAIKRDLTTYRVVSTLWDGEPRRASIEHDSIHDEP
jgi:hypothetical protein